jgi:alkanesulfonate monooxygenase SsuD/methylene tetrahydromethanopterin reductase-like flavin-dependent oxidoreductase (luciferase family)
MADGPPVLAEEETDPVEIARAHGRRERFERNWAWLEQHAADVYRHRGKVVAIAGQELFVGDTTEEALAQAKAAHPEDDGLFTRIIPRERGPRIYAY